MTVCNMTIEGGGRAGMIAPDETTFAWFTGSERPGAPRGAELEQAIERWRELRTEEGASFDREIVIDAAAISPQVTWGTNPGMVRSVTDRVPSPEEFDTPADREATERALAYMAPAARNADRADRASTACSSAPAPTRGSAICAPPREVVAGRKVRRERQRDGRSRLPAGQGAGRGRGPGRVFREAGFDWRVAGCSMCLGMNPDILAPGERCASTSNRNFEGRQGRGGRTHLVSPQMAAAAAIEGRFVDIRDWT